MTSLRRDCVLPAMAHFSRAPQLPLSTPAINELKAPFIKVEYLQNKPSEPPGIHILHSSHISSLGVVTPLASHLSRLKAPLLRPSTYLSLTIPHSEGASTVELTAAAPYLPESSSANQPLAGQETFKMFGSLFRSILCELSRMSLIEEPFTVKAVVSPLTANKPFPVMRAGFDLLSTLSTPPRPDNDHSVADYAPEITDFSVWNIYSQGWLRNSDAFELPEIGELYLAIQKLYDADVAVSAPELQSKIELASQLAAFEAATTDDERYQLAASLAISDDPGHLRQALSILHPVSENYYDIVKVWSLRKEVEQELSWKCAPKD